jgi:hypothetical protein
MTNKELVAQVIKELYASGENSRAVSVGLVLQAVSFYADTENWKRDQIAFSDMEAIQEDRLSGSFYGGKIAREVLNSEAR